MDYLLLARHRGKHNRGRPFPGHNVLGMLGAGKAIIPLLALLAKLTHCLIYRALREGTTLIADDGGRMGGAAPSETVATLFEMLQCKSLNDLPADPLDHAPTGRRAGELIPPALR